MKLTLALCYNYRIKKEHAMGIKKDVELREHQVSSTNKIVDGSGSLLLYHGVGTGKTLSAIAAKEALTSSGKGGKALVVAPASLRENFATDGVKKFTNSSYTVLGNKQELSGKGKGLSDIDKTTPQNSKDYSIVSYDMFKKDAKKYLENTGADTVIYDELHRAKNESSALTKVIKEARPFHKNFIGLTGSLTSNTPADMVPLVDAMTNGRHVLGSKTSFEGRFLSEDSSGKKTLKNKTVLQAITSPYVDYVDRDNLKGFAPPKRNLKIHKLTMGDEQSDIYRSAIDKIDTATKAKMILGVGKLNEREMKHIGNKLMAARQASNAPHSVVNNMSVKESFDQSVKAQALISNVKDHLKKTPDGQVIIGTQFVHGGVDILSHGLKEAKIPFALFSGKGNKGVTEKSRTQAVKDYNAGKAKAILITSAGGEGLNLPNTTSVHMFDGHWNPEVTEQMEARGLRSGGLSHRAIEDRVVELNRYEAKPDVKVTGAASGLLSAISPMTYLNRMYKGEKVFSKPTIREFSADEFVSKVSDRKRENNTEIDNLFKSAKYLGDEKDIMQDYYDDIGMDKVMGAVGTGEFIDEAKERKHIDKLRKHYVSVAESKNYQLIDTKGAPTKFTKKDFDEDGELKTSSKFNPSKNTPLKAGMIGAAGLIGGTIGGRIRKNNEHRIGVDTNKAIMMLTSQSQAMGGIFAAVGGTLGLKTGKTDYSSQKQATAKKRKKFTDEVLLRMIRGENVTKEKVKVDNHAIG